MVCKRMPWGQGTKWRAPGRMVGGVAAWGGGWHIVQMTSVPLESPASEVARQGRGLTEYVGGLIDGLTCML